MVSFEGTEEEKEPDSMMLKTNGDPQKMKGRSYLDNFCCYLGIGEK
jgi:ribosomal protein L35AE/L33A